MVSAKRAGWLRLSGEFAASLSPSPPAVCRIFQAISRGGSRQVVLIGPGELAEIALLASRDADVRIRSIFDSKSNTERLYGLEVLYSLDEIEAGQAL